MGKESLLKQLSFSPFIATASHRPFLPIGGPPLDLSLSPAYCELKFPPIGGTYISRRKIELPTSLLPTNWWRNFPRAIVLRFQEARIRATVSTFDLRAVNIHGSRCRIYVQCISASHSGFKVN